MPISLFIYINFFVFDSSPNLSLHLYVMSYTLHLLFILLWCQLLLYFVVVSPVSSVWNRRTLQTCHFWKTAVFVRAHKARVPVAKSVRCTGTWRTLLFPLDMSPNPFYQHWHPSLTKYHFTSFSRSFGSHFFWHVYVLGDVRSVWPWSRNSTFVTSSPATDTRVWARGAVKGKGGREAGQNKRHPYPLKFPLEDSNEWI